MEQYIPKSNVVAKIDDRRDKIIKGIATIPLRGRQRVDAALEYEILGKVRDFLDTLEVKEVDLKKEYRDYINCDNGHTMFEIAVHFFELGLKASQKGEKV